MTSATRSDARLGTIAVAVLLGVAWPRATLGAEVKFSWDPSPTSEEIVAGYRLYYGVVSGSPYDGTEANEGPSPVDIPIETFEDPQSPEFVLTGMSSCVHYFFAVTTYSHEGEESEYSNEVEGTAVASPDPVLARPGGPTSLIVEWALLPHDDDGAIPRYRIHFDTAPGDPYEGEGSPVSVEATTLSASARGEHEIEGLWPSTQYFVAVEAVCDDGETNMSDEVSAITEEEEVEQVDGGPIDVPEGGCSCQVSPRGASGAPLGLLLGFFGWRVLGRGRGRGSREAAARDERALRRRSSPPSG